MTQVPESINNKKFAYDLDRVDWTAWVKARSLPI